MIKIDMDMLMANFIMVPSPTGTSPMECVHPIIHVLDSTGMPLTVNHNIQSTSSYCDHWDEYKSWYSNNNYNDELYSSVGYDKKFLSFTEFRMMIDQEYNCDILVQRIGDEWRIFACDPGVPTIYEWMASFPDLYEFRTGSSEGVAEWLHENLTGPYSFGAARVYSIGGLWDHKVIKCRSTVDATLLKLKFGTK